MIEHVLFCSYGNDSIALIQWAHEHRLKNVVTLYSDTGWAAPSWENRVKLGEGLARSYGFTTSRTTSIGMHALVFHRKGWPRQGMQFCTSELKIKPAQAWLSANDPDGCSVCVVGVRREESANRSAFPEWTESSEAHGGRSLWAPLVNVNAAERDELIGRAKLFSVLPHRSMECFPCINSNRADLRLLAQDPGRIDEINRIEIEMGVTTNGKQRTMFRPYRHMGAVGIRNVVEWAKADHGKYDPTISRGCDSGFCGQ